MTVSYGAFGAWDGSPDPNVRDGIFFAGTRGLMAHAVYAKASLI